MLKKYTQWWTMFHPNDVRMYWNEDTTQAHSMLPSHTNHVYVWFDEQCSEAQDMDAPVYLPTGSTTKNIHARFIRR